MRVGQGQHATAFAASAPPDREAGYGTRERPLPFCVSGSVPWHWQARALGHVIRAIRVCIAASR